MRLPQCVSHTTDDDAILILEPSTVKVLPNELLVWIRLSVDHSWLSCIDFHGDAYSVSKDK